MWSSSDGRLRNMQGLLGEMMYLALPNRTHSKQGIKVVMDMLSWLPTTFYLNKYYKCAVLIVNNSVVDDVPTAIGIC